MLNMGRKASMLIGLLIILVGAVGCQPDVESAVQLAQAMPSATMTSTAIPPTDTPTLAPTNTLPSPYVAVEQLPSLTPTDVPTAVPTNTPRPTRTKRPTRTPRPTETVAPTPTETQLAPTPSTVAAAPVENGCLPLSQTRGIASPYKVYAANWTRPGAWDSEVYTGNVSYNMIHLGFDVEGHPTHLGKLLDVLDKHGIKTTMFVVGGWSQSYSDWIQDIASRGHEFANHTWSHANMRDLTGDQVKKELNDTELLIQQLTGQTTKPWFRPPFGSRSKESLQAAYEAGWTHVIWSGSAEDWREGTTVERMCATLKQGAYPGSILYAHTSNPGIVEAVDRFIGEMHMQGFTFVPLSVIMSTAPGNYLVSQ